MQGDRDPNAWLGIELRHLAALKAVAEEQSFVRAAKRLGYTQSAISNQIATLERVASTRLVERARGGSSTSLTEAGQLLYEHAVALMARLQAAQMDVAASWPDAGVVLRVGYFQSVGPTLLPRIVHAFREREPDVRFEFELGDAEQLLQEVVAGGGLDIAFVSAPLRAQGLASSHLFDDPFVLLAPPGEELPLVPNFAARPLLAYKPCAVQRQHEASLQRRYALPPARLVWLEDALTIQALVGAGCAYGLLPAMAVTSAELVVAVLDGAPREVHLVWRRDRPTSEALRHFVETAVATCGELARAS